MLYTEKEKNEIERVRKVFEKHIQQMTAYDLVWSDKVGYVWLAISIDPIYIDTGNWNLNPSNVIKEVQVWLSVQSAKRQLILVTA